MEITSTRVAPEGQMIAVEFLGEGGEFVSVVMSNVDNNIAAEDAVQHAQALLAQVSLFGNATDDAINSYDALSNGNLDDGRHDATTVFAEKLSENVTNRGQDAHDTLAGGSDVDREMRPDTGTISTATPT
jgi:hypothetical protein